MHKNVKKCLLFCFLVSKWLILITNDLRGSLLMFSIELFFHLLQFLI